MVPPTATADSECLCVLFAAAVAAAAAAAAAAVEAEAAAADDRKFTPGNAEAPPECIADEAAAGTPVAPVTFNDDTPLGDRNCHALRMLSWPTLSDNAGVGFRPGRAYPTFWAYDRLWRHKTFERGEFDILMKCGVLPYCVVWHLGIVLMLSALPPHHVQLISYMLRGVNDDR